MSRRPFDPSELDPPLTDGNGAVSELESYVATTATGAPRGLSERVRAAVETEPVPRRGFLAWLLIPPASAGGMRRFVRTSALGATLVLAVAGALFAGQLAGVLRNVGSGSPTPTESVSSTPTESSAPSLIPSPELTSPGKPSASEGAHESPEPSGTPEASEHETPGPSAADAGEDSGATSPKPMSGNGS